LFSFSFKVLLATCKLQALACLPSIQNCDVLQITVSKEEAERFCSIFPPKQEEEKVIAFPAGS
jgi:hypothetical protein